MAATPASIEGSGNVARWPGLPPESALGAYEHLLEAGGGGATLYGSSARGVGRSLSFGSRPRRKKKKQPAVAEW